jgi:hypothetical protein
VTSGFVWDSYRRLIQMFGKTVLGVDGEAFAHALDAAKSAKGVRDDVGLDAEDLRELVEVFKQIVLDTPAGRSRRTRVSSWTSPRRRCSPRGTPTGRGSTDGASASRTTWGRR